jgi:hypothetical protein
MKRGCLWQSRFAFAGIEESGHFLKKVVQKLLLLWACGGETSAVQS